MDWSFSGVIEMDFMQTKLQRLDCCYISNNHLNKTQIYFYIEVTCFGKCTCMAFSTLSAEFMAWKLLVLSLFS